MVFWGVFGHGGNFGPGNDQEKKGGNYDDTPVDWLGLDSDKSMYAHVAVDIHGAVFKYHIIAKYVNFIDLNLHK